MRTLRFCLILLVPVMLARCTALQEMGSPLPRPGFEIRRVEFLGLDLSGVTLRWHAAVQNPYPVAVPRAAFDAGLGLEGTHLMQLQTELGEGVPANGETEFTVDSRLPFDALVAVYEGLPRDELLDLELKGVVDLYFPETQASSVPGLPEKFSVDVAVSEQFPAISPAVEVRNFRLERPSLGSALQVAPLLAGVADRYLNSLLEPGGFSPGSAAALGLGGLNLNLNTSFDLVLKNEAAARVLFESVNYTFFLSGHRLFEGTGTDIQQLESESVVTIRSSFPLASITAALANAIKNRSAAFRVTGQSGLTIPALSDDSPLRLSFDESGPLSW